MIKKYEIDNNKVLYIKKKYRFHLQIKKNKSYKKKYLYLDVNTRKLILKDRNST